MWHITSKVMVNTTKLVMIDNSHNQSHNFKFGNGFIVCHSKGKIYKTVDWNESRIFKTFLNKCGSYFMLLQWWILILNDWLQCLASIACLCGWLDVTVRNMKFLEVGYRSDLDITLIYYLCIGTKLESKSLVLFIFHSVIIWKVN